MGAHQHARMRPEAAPCGQRLLLEYVQHRMRRAAPVERSQQRPLVHQPAARDIHQHGAGLHRVEEIRIDHAARLVRQRRGQHDDIGFRQCAGKARRLDHGIGRLVSRGATAHAGHMRVEASRAPGHRTADMAHADHQPAGISDLPELDPLPQPAALLLPPLLTAMERFHDARHYIVRDRRRGGVAVADDGAPARQQREDRRVVACGAGLQPAQRPRMAQHAEEGAHRAVRVEAAGGIGGFRRDGMAVNGPSVRAANGLSVVHDGDIEARKRPQIGGKPVTVGPVEEESHGGRPRFAGCCASTTPRGRPRQRSARQGSIRPGTRQRTAGLRP